MLKNVVLMTLACTAVAIIIVGGFAIAIGLDFLGMKIAWWVSLIFIVLFVISNDRRTSLRSLFKDDED
jgi:uncharacterized membrane protein